MPRRRQPLQTLLRLARIRERGQRAALASAHEAQRESAELSEEAQQLLDGFRSRLQAQRDEDGNLHVPAIGPGLTPLELEGLRLQGYALADNAAEREAALREADDRLLEEQQRYEDVRKQEESAKRAVDRRRRSARLAAERARQAELDELAAQQQRRPKR